MFRNFRNVPVRRNIYYCQKENHMRNLNKDLIFRDLYVHIKCAAITANKSDVLQWLLSLCSRGMSCVRSRSPILVIAKLVAAFFSIFQDSAEIVSQESFGSTPTQLIVMTVVCRAFPFHVEHLFFIFHHALPQMGRPRSATSFLCETSSVRRNMRHIGGPVYLMQDESHRISCLFFVSVSTNTQQ